MSRIVIALLLSASLLPAGPAHANPGAYDFSLARSLLSEIKVPPEWDGVWTTEDSLYDCTTGFKSFFSSADTLCSGQVYNGGSLNFTCSGTADATSFHATCSGSEPVFTDCLLTFDIQIDGTRTGDSYRSVTVTNSSYSGTGTGCDLLPPNCTRSVTYGTRTGAAPSAYCLTPVSQTTWGQIKVKYR